MRVKPGYFYSLLLTGILVSGLESCSKKEQNPVSSATDLKSFHFVPGQDQTDIQPVLHRIKVISSNTLNGKQLTAYYSLSPGAGLTLNGVPQQSGITVNNFEQDLTYTVTAADNHTKTSWVVQATNNENSIAWGMGHFINHSASQNRTYNWYIDQSSSGTFSSINCGPASVTMAVRWADSTFSKTAIDARETYRSGGGWWFTSDINAYLNDYDIPHAIIGLSDTATVSQSILTKQLDNHQIIILCLDMDFVRLTSNTGFRVDKFYPTSPGWGHFLVLKGYQQVDGEVFFESYDPFSFGQMNTDQTFKGMSRYYRTDDLAAACRPWWNYAIVIAKKGETLSTDATKRKLDPDHVPLAHNF